MSREALSGFIRPCPSCHLWWKRRQVPQRPRPAASHTSRTRWLAEGVTCYLLPGCWMADPVLVVFDQTEGCFASLGPLCKRIGIFVHPWHLGGGGRGGTNTSWLPIFWSLTWAWRKRYICLLIIANSSESKQPSTRHLMSFIKCSDVLCNRRQVHRRKKGLFCCPLQWGGLTDSRKP